MKKMSCEKNTSIKEKELYRDDINEVESDK